VDGGEVQTGGNIYTLTNVTATHTVSVTFKQSQFTISGTITCAGLALADVNMVGLGVVTDANGFYSAIVSSGWSGVVTPAKYGYTFDPNSRSYTNVSSDQMAQDYNALPSDDFNDSRRSAMWRTAVENLEKTWLSEDANVLNTRATGWLNLLSPCVGHWKMNDNALNKVVVDDSGKGHNGTSVRDTNLMTTTGKINGALKFNGSSDYVSLGTIIGTGSYTKAAWIKLETTTSAYGHNILSGKPSQAFWAPNSYGNKLSSGHNLKWNQVQDSNSLTVGVWYFVAVSYDSTSNTLKLYKDANVVDTNSTTTPQALTELNIGRYDSTATYLKGAIDDVMLFNRVLTNDEIAALYNAGNGTEDISGGSYQASYAANGWSFDVAEDFAVKVDFHYSDTSGSDGWTGMSVGDDANYVSISTGADNSGSYFYYEAVVDGNVVSEKESRASSDGTLYVSYDSALRKFYVSHTGFGSGNAHVWQAPNATKGQWGLPVDVSVGGGSSGAALSSGEAYLNNFEMKKAGLLGWSPATDIDGNGFIELDDLVEMCDNWLESGAGDIDNNGIVDFFDFAEFGLAW
jgi:hypothetical protein